MHIKIIRSANDILTTDIQGDNIKHILSGLKLHFGQELTDSLLSDQYRYVLLNHADPDSAQALQPEVIGSTLAGYDTLIIVRDIDGEVPLALVASAMVELGMGALSVGWAYAATVLVNVALSFALNGIMSLLSPTPEFNSDPSQNQQLNSNLFNGAPAIREQGGIVPLILGAPYCGGVVISSGVSSEDY